jgi:hypothetical protein
LSYSDVSTASIPAVTTSNAPITYTLPTGFEPATIKDAAGVSGAFKKSKLGGKQIWYFTAPASIPISSIQSMSLLDMKNGDAVYSHDGIDYGFSQDTQDIAEESSHTIIMVPSPDKGYQTGRQKPRQPIARLIGVFSLEKN